MPRAMTSRASFCHVFFRNPSNLCYFVTREHFPSFSSKSIEFVASLLPKHHVFNL